MNKKIVLMVINMNIGGTEKALLNMIPALRQKGFDITILMLERDGGFLNAIPKDVEIELIGNYETFKQDLQDPPVRTILRHFKSGKVLKAFNIFTIHAITKLTKERSLFYKYLLKDVPEYKNQYDIAVAYAGPMELISYFIAYKVNAGKKIQWVHFDINQIGFNANYASKIFNFFDRIFVVSDEGRGKLVDRVPSLSEKTAVFPNVISQQLIEQQADAGEGYNDDDFKGIRILTVGRLSLEKGQDIAIKALAKLKNEGFDVKWYCVGKGGMGEKYKQMAEKLHVKDHFIFLGETPNPYHYMKHCDIYVQPSRHEGYCITLAEAKALHKPIVSTNFTGAKEQIEHDQTGLIVNGDETSIAQAVKKLINKPALRETFSSNLANEMVYNESDIKKMHELL
ncbi:Glycosyltransferase involved in cell wall bisynthesis [Lentibacillus persicus]|uniref:Glycosyltransferase involved in cell wall bisynthesis n=1 Tax=Lentibacillus persicus TaxID=640948 RepID=A0A1I1U825_9BACI|nr:glycosyltransferase [Lentibacillus persicus]SFD66972.1 Glycosyltransferase involved in cell wall bisynthesis [Lentibacillus persicus]